MKRRLRGIISFILTAVLLFNSLAFNISAERDTVARLTFFCYVRTPGHSWIYVENLSDSPLKVGVYSVQPGQGVSVGTFGATRFDGSGIYYNVEAYCQNTYGLDGFSTLTEELNAEQVRLLTEKILSYRNDWDAVRNCVCFAVSVWNCFSDKKLAYVPLPAFLELQVFVNGGGQSNVKQKPVTASQVLRQIGNGSSAYLVQVSRASLGNLW